MVDATPRALTWAVWDEGDRDGEKLRWLRREPVEGRCVGLGGQIGGQVHCSIYELRPQACREFEAGSDCCHALRRMYGIEPELETGERAAHALLLKESVSDEIEELQDDELWPADEADRTALMRELIEYNTAKLEGVIAEMKRLGDCLGKHGSKRGEAMSLAAVAAVESDVRALGVPGDDLFSIGVASQQALEQASEQLAELGQVAFEILEMQVCADKSTA
jgi:Fe-S-cluster containining protein